jgi:hypothetical protein
MGHAARSTCVAEGATWANAVVPVASAIREAVANAMRRSIGCVLAIVSLPSNVFSRRLSFVDNVVKPRFLCGASREHSGRRKR